MLADSPDFVVFISPMHYRFLRLRLRSVETCVGCLCTHTPRIVRHVSMPSMRQSKYLPARLAIRSRWMAMPTFLSLLLFPFLQRGRVLPHLPPELSDTLSLYFSNYSTRSTWYVQVNFVVDIFSILVSTAHRFSLLPFEI